MCRGEHRARTEARLFCQVPDPSRRDPSDHDGHVGRNGPDSCEPILQVRIATCSERSRPEYGDALLVEFEGELDLYSARSVAAPIDEIVSCSRDAVIDVSSLSFIDAGGLSLIESIRDRATRQGGTVWLHGANPRILEILEIIPIEGVMVCESLVPSA